MGHEGVCYNDIVGLLDESYTFSNLGHSPVYAGNFTYDTLGLTRPHFYTKPWSKSPVQKKGTIPG